MLYYLDRIWGIVEPLSFVLIVIIFLMDPIRRWNFFGYRPTAVMGLFDPHAQKVIFSQINKVCKVLCRTR